MCPGLAELTCACRRSHASLLGQLRSLVGRFPGELGLGAAEVPISSRLPVDRTTQVEALDDRLSGVSEKFLRTSSVSFASADLARAERLHQNAYRLGNADRIGQLNLRLVGETRSHDVLGDVASHVGSRAVNLGRILARERAAAVTARATVGIHDDLAAGQAGIAHAVRRSQSGPSD